MENQHDRRGKRRGRSWRGRGGGRRQQQQHPRSRASGKVVEELVSHNYVAGRARGIVFYVWGRDDARHFRRCSTAMSRSLVRTQKALSSAQNDQRILKKLNLGLQTESWCCGGGKCRV